MASSRYSGLQHGQAIEVVDVCARYIQDPDSDTKINLSIGGYVADEQLATLCSPGHVFQVVKSVEQQMANDPSLQHNYMPALGWPDLNKAALELLLGKDHPVLLADKAFCVQSIGGTGPLRIGADLLSRQLGYTSVLYSDPTWINHKDIFLMSGFGRVLTYPYWNSTKKDLDFEAMMAALAEAQPDTVVVLHACAHNPTGVDPSRDQWRRLCQLIQSRRLFPFFDCAYQGFASGHLDQDAWPVRYFASQGLEMLVSQSFGKNMSLYGERIGFLCGTVSDPGVKARILSQLTLIVRPMYSNPALHGARIVRAILTCPRRMAEWTEELKSIVATLTERRRTLRRSLERLAGHKDWSGITKQIGMFYYSGLSEEQGNLLMTKHHVYILPSSGRINLGALTESRMEFVAAAIADVCG